MKLKEIAWKVAWNGYWFIFLIAVAVLISNIRPFTIDVHGEIDYYAYDRVSKVSCKSNSMGLTMNCGDAVYETKVKDNDKLIPGDIYIYKKLNYTVVHRLVYCLDENCSKAVFKGDNNEKGELINRSQVIFKVEKVEYR